MQPAAELPVSRKFPARAIHLEHEGRALVFRPTLITDADEVYEALAGSLPELKAWMPWSHLEQTPAGQVERLRACESDYFAGRELVMGLFDGGRMLSMVGLHPRVELNPNALEIGYWAPTRTAGRGYTTLGVRVAAIYAFDKLGCDRLQVSHDEENAASRRVIEKCGFEKEAVVRGLTARPTEALLAGGLRWSGRHLMWAMWPDTFAAQPWVASLRASLRYENIVGRPLSSSS